MNAQEADNMVRVECHGLDPDPYECTVRHPEVPGEFCFPPLASLITGAARLMLALLEHSVTELGGTYAMEDTDSMAIVATKRGGIVPCPGGPSRTQDGRAAVRALSWEQVKEISDRFLALNPYDQTIIPVSVLKIEDVNFDPQSGEQREVYCIAISAKRYSLFLKDEKGEPVLLRKHSNSNSNGWKEHGLGHLLNPSDSDSEDRDWIGQWWLNFIRRSLGLPASELAFARLPAVGRVSISSPAVMKPLTDFNADKPYRDQIKPFNFLLTAQTVAFGHPTGADPKRFHLIAPYERDPRKWLKADWIDQYRGKRYQITTTGLHGGRKTARVKTYGDVLVDYEHHPESKCADVHGNVCGKQTVGHLYRRHIEINRIVYVGKESNRLEEVESGMIQDEESVYTEYPDPRRDEWETKIRPELKKCRLAWLVKNTPFSKRSLIEWRAGRCRPHLDNQTSLRTLLESSDSKNGSEKRGRLPSMGRRAVGR